MRFKNKNFAFTLAEVLITLGIIGVVAVLTLPVVKSKIENYVLRNQFLKFYASFSSTIKNMEYENGGIFKCYYYPGGEYSECNDFWNKFFEHYKVIKICNYNTDKSCAPVYKSKSQIIADGGAWLNPSCSDMAHFNYSAHVLADGTIVYISGYVHSRYQFVVDINGHKGPNKWGYDVFTLNLSPQQNANYVKITDMICTRYEKGGRRLKNVLLNNYNINRNPFLYE